MKSPAFAVEKVRTLDGSRSWTVVDLRGVPIRPIDDFLWFFGVLARSPNTIVSDAYDLRLFAEFLADERLAWTDMTVDHLVRFVRWLEQPVGDVVLLADQDPARGRRTIARAMNVCTPSTTSTRREASTWQLG
jgi:integrase/recombinase XerD